jgi:hypothetical protein
LLAASENPADLRVTAGFHDRQIEDRSLVDLEPPKIIEI